MTDCIVTHAVIIDIIIIVILATILQWTDEKCGFGLKLSLTRKLIEINHEWYPGVDSFLPKISYYFFTIKRYYLLS